MLRINRDRERSQGQILALFAGGLVALILVTGLVIDGGNVFLQRRAGQNASDVAAMAGTKRLADFYAKPAGSPGKVFAPGDNPYSIISTRMGQNDCSGSTCIWTARYVGPRTGSTFADLGPVGAGDSAPPNGALGVKVDVTKTPRTYFLGVIGKTDWTVSTVATALAGKLTNGPTGQLLPIAMTEMPTQEGAIYALTSGANGPGQFGWLSWTGSNDPNHLADSICTPDNPGFNLPAEFPGDPGKSNANGVRNCLQQWVNNKQVVLIPVVINSNDPANSGSCSTGGAGNNFTYCIVAIAAFVITSFDQPAVDQINGRFVGTIPYSMTGNASVPGGGGVTAPPDEGGALYAIGLAQ